MTERFRRCGVLVTQVGCLLFLAARVAVAQRPVLNTVYPAGGQIGQSVEVNVSGSHLQETQTLRSSVPGVRSELLDGGRFRLTIPVDAKPGSYNLWAVGENGVSAPRTFVLGTLPEQMEDESNETAEMAMQVMINSVVNGMIEKAGDADFFRFEASRGQRVLIECQAERVDSRLRAVVEVYDTQGRRLAVNRGYYGVDPLADFLVPANGSYVVKVHDLIAGGSAEHYYRLCIDAGPRVAYALPGVVEAGRPTRVSLYGWNLPGAEPREDASTLERIEVEIPATMAHAAWPLPARLEPTQMVLGAAAFPFYLAGSQTPVILGVSDVPVVSDGVDNHTHGSAKDLIVPCEVSGQLTAGDEQDWYAISARRGEVFYLEALGQRISSPVDLQLSVEASPRDETAGERDLARFADEVRGGSGPFSTAHLDPAGRWVCPSDGRYLIAVRNITGGLASDPRRTYRLSVRREEPDFEVIVVPRSNGSSGLNVPRGGRESFDLVALRKRGCDGAIRVSARDLPAGLECPDVWFGPGVDRAVGVLAADPNALAVSGELKLSAVAEVAGTAIHRPVFGGVVVRSGTPTGWGRLVGQMPVAVAGESTVRVVANAHEVLEHQLYGKLPVKHSPGGIVDVAVQIERRDSEHRAAVKLSVLGLPDVIETQTAVVPPGEESVYLSFYLPPSLPVGPYSFVVQAETTMPGAGEKSAEVMAFSNPLTIDVQPAAFRVDVDPFAVRRARRGEVIQIAYRARRLNGFIGKTHTELAAPGCITDVPGLRGRGETFVGQSENGSLQIEINDTAPLGQQLYLRLFTVGVVEDEAVYQGSRFLSLEIVE